MRTDHKVLYSAALKANECESVETPENHPKDETFCLFTWSRRPTERHAATERVMVGKITNGEKAWRRGLEK